MKQEHIEIQINNNKQKLLAKINELIISERKRFIQQYGESSNVTYRTVKDQTLTDWQVEQHLNGNITLGCFYKGKYSKFLTFDIDERNPTIPLELIRLLKGYGFQTNELHLEDSGSKGWHLWLFFDTPLPIQDLSAFGNFVREELGTLANSIELRPDNPMTSKGIKLPFGMHRKVMCRTVFIGHDLQEVNDPTFYFLHIQPMNYNKFNKIWQSIQPEIEHLTHKDDVVIAKEVLQTPVPQGSLLAGFSLAQNLIQYGMNPEEMTDARRRHYYQFFVILYYKHQGFNENETAKKVIDWAINEKNCGRSKSSEEEITLDVLSDVRCVYGENKQFSAMHCNQITVSHQDIAYLQDIADETTRRVVWCIIIIGRMFQIQGQFFFSLRKIESMTGCKKSTVHSRVKQLLNDGVIELKQKGSFYNQQASNYYMSLLEEYQPDTILPTEATTFQGIFEDSYSYISSLSTADLEGA